MTLIYIFSHTVKPYVSCTGDLKDVLKFFYQRFYRFFHAAGSVYREFGTWNRHSQQIIHTVKIKLIAFHQPVAESIVLGLRIISVFRCIYHGKFRIFPHCMDQPLYDLPVHGIYIQASAIAANIRTII